jgi:acyl-CoA thioesterase I
VNPLTMHLASGESLFSGAGLLLLALLVSLWCRTRWTRLLRNLVAWSALVLILGSSTPHPTLVDVLFAGLFVGWLAAEEIERIRRRFAPARARILLACVVILVAAVEFPHLQTPELPPATGMRLYVLGDSISAGIGDGYPPWPEVLAAKVRVPVTNLAMAGATVGEAVAWARRVAEHDAVVLVEIGGNDLLNGTSSEEFERHLRALLAALNHPERLVVMLELPLVPFFAGYGRAQRRLAEEHGVFLVPKRIFAGVLATPGATADGLHLSAAGTRLMAERLLPILAPALGQ